MHGVLVDIAQGSLAQFNHLAQLPEAHSSMVQFPLVQLSLVQSSFTPLFLAQLNPLVIWNAVWPYLLMLLGFSVIVFVHELGHFAVAKWCGVKVDRFAIGFGRELVGFTKGETRYSFNLLPLGGYVKMLGQEDFDEKSNEFKFKDDPRSFANKPVGRRMAIVSAGVVMNVLFACLLFMIVFLVGTEVISPRIAYVEPDSPAETAGLLPGDEIESVNGERVLEFNEITMAILLSPPHEPIEIRVKRDGEMADPVYVKPEYRQPENTRQARRQIIGIGPGVTREIVGVGPEIDTTRGDLPHIGDQLVEVDGIEVTEENISQVAELLGFTERPVIVERKDLQNLSAPPKRIEVTIPPQLAVYPSESGEPDSVSILGLTPLTRFDMVDPRGRGYLAGIDTGDTILSWDDQRYPSNSDIAASVRHNPDRDLAFEILKPDGRRVKGSVRPERNGRGPATIQALTTSHKEPPDYENAPQSAFYCVHPYGVAARAGIESGDVILKFGDIESPSTSTVNMMVRSNPGRPWQVTVRKKGSRTLTTSVTPIRPGSIDAGHNLLADNVMIVGQVVEQIHGRPSPAAVVGIKPGSRIVQAQEQKVERWRDLISIFQEHAGGTVRLIVEQPDGKTNSVDFPIPHSLRTKLGVGPEARILSIDNRQTVKTYTKRGEEEVSVRYHEGTRAILEDLVGEEQVPVEFRCNLLTPIETAHINVTEDMVDPWLGRITFSPNVTLADQTRILKGNNALDAVWIGLHKTYYFIAQVYQVIHRMIFSRSVSIDTMSGPLGIVDVGGQIAQASFVRFLFFLAIISANLAVINFLPLPIVDGGLMVFLIIEKIKGSPVSLRVQVATQMIGIFLIIGLFLFVTYNDAMRMWG